MASCSTEDLSPMNHYGDSSGAIVNKDLIYVSKACLPFIGIQISVLLLITYMPSLALWLPKILGFIK
jgi:hypothetical protein